MSEWRDVDIDHLKLQQIIANIDQKLADRDPKRQEIQYAPWSVLAAGAGAAAALMAAGAALFKLLQH